MEDGAAGDIGLLVLVTLVRKPDGGVATTLILEMGETNALVQSQKQNHVQVFSNLIFFFYNHYLVNGGWGSWASWSSCDSSTQKQYKTRYCNNPSPKNGGSPCAGSHKSCLGIP